MIIGDCFKLRSLGNNFTPVLRKLYSPPSFENALLDREISTTKKIGMLERALELERKVDLIAL